MVGEVLRSPGFEQVWLVNPSYDEVAGHPCLPDLQAVGEAPDLVLLGVGDGRLVDQLTAAAKVGARGAVVFGSAHGEGVREELRAIARDAGLALFGAGCMGFWNVRRGLRALGYVEREDLPVGPVSLVTHSGSVFSTLLRTRLRLGFDLAVSSGQELVTTTADYVDHIVDHTDTRVLALVLETVRDGAHLRSSLRRAREAGIEVVLLPVGGSPLGAVARRRPLRRGGRRAPRPGRRCATTWPVTSSATSPSSATPWRCWPRRGGRDPGAGLATVHDSGAERSLVADLAHDARRPVRGPLRRARGRRSPSGSTTGSNPATRSTCGVAAPTPARLFADCLRAVAADPAVGVTALAVDLVPEYDGDTSYLDAVLDVADDHRRAARRADRSAGGSRRGGRRPAPRRGRAGARGFPQRAARPPAPARRRRTTAAPTPLDHRPVTDSRAAARGVRHPDSRSTARRRARLTCWPPPRRSAGRSC